MLAQGSNQSMQGLVGIACATEGARAVVPIAAMATSTMTILRIMGISSEVWSSDARSRFDLARVGYLIPTIRSVIVITT